MARDWREYFTERFSDEARFAVEADDDEILVTDPTGQSHTEIEIRLAPDGKLEDVAFFNPDTRGWNNLEHSQLSFRDPYCDLPFTPGDVATVESLLAIPLYHGWKEKVFYLEGDHVKSLVRVDLPGQMNRTVYMENGGCLLSPFLAIRYSAWFAGDRMQSRTVVVEPMIGDSPVSGSLGRRPVVDTRPPPTSEDVEARRSVETSPAVGWVGVILFLVLLLVVLRWC